MGSDSFKLETLPVFYPDLWNAVFAVDNTLNTTIIADHATVIAQTTNWIKSVVIGCHFCPFAAEAMMKKSIRYQVLPETNTAHALEALVNEFHFLDHESKIETSFLLFPNHFEVFEDYLELVRLAEDLLSELGYDGVYQIASFHPEYCFAGATNDDPANYTNRSVYPMLHLLREESITRALEHFPDPEDIPHRNIDYATKKGLMYMQRLRAACFEI